MLFPFLHAEVFTSVRGWADIQLGIASPSVFNVPSECKDAKPLHSDKVMTIMTRVGISRRRRLSQVKILHKLFMKQLTDFDFV